MNELATVERVSSDLQEKVLLGGDLNKLSAGERLSFYNSVCTSLALNPLTRPFEYIVLNGKLTLYARKDCTEQLRTKRSISINILSRELVEGVFIVTAQAVDAHGRTDESIGAVPIANLQGEAKANAMMKAETKAKRRVTLSICGLGMLDESEVDSIPGARTVVEKDTRTLREKVQAKIVIDSKGGAQPEAPRIVYEPTIEHTAPAPPPAAPVPAGEAMPTASPATLTASQMSPQELRDLLDKQAASIIWNAGTNPPKGHRGKDIREVPDEYLGWYVKNGPQQEFIDKAREELERRNAEQLFQGEERNDDGN